MFEHLDKLQALEDRYIDLEAKISDPSVISDQAQWQEIYQGPRKTDRCGGNLSGLPKITEDL